MSALKIAVFANANINLLEESSYNNSHTYTDERHLNLDIFVCNHKSWMSLLAEILISHIIKNWGNNSIKILGHALTYVLASMARSFTVETVELFLLLSYIVMSIFCIHITKLTYIVYHETDNYAKKQ